MKVTSRLVIAIATLMLLAMAIGLAGGMLAWEQRQALTAFGQMAHRQISQRVEQHDAHLTSLSALTQSGDAVPAEALRQVAASIRQFYPRITGIEVVAIEAGAARPVLGAALAAEIEGVARQAGAAASLTLTPAGTLLLAKRAGGDDARHHALVLTLDPVRLMTPDQPLPAGTALLLALADRPVARIGEVSKASQLMFREPLASRTQPLQLTLLAKAGSWALPSPGLLALMAGLALLGGGLAERLVAASQRAREASRASARARLDARLAHAGRINTMGEMASGIAHELTQPLTAILSQAQAGQRLAQMPAPDLAVIAGAFEATARNAKRAGDILAKLRSWVSQGATPAQPVPLADVAGDVVGLLRLNPLPAGVSLDLAIPEPAPVVLADRTQLEQVVFNLMRNAIEAVSGQEGPQQVRLTLAIDAPHGVVTVEDSGPGLSATAREKLFEPFFTTKAEGMGLGLALCHTLVERFGGTLTAGTSPLGGAAFSAKLPLAMPDGKEAAR